MLNTLTGPIVHKAGLAREWIQNGVSWSPLSPAYISDPYPTYRKLREKAPVYWSSLSNQFLVSRYDDVNSILKDNTNFNKDFNKGDPSKRGKFARSKVPQNLLTMDPPDHTRLRSLVNKAFTPRSVTKMEDYIRSTAHQLLDSVDDASEFDLMEVLANPLPVIVIAKMIGIPEKDLREFMTWSNQYVRILEPILSGKELEIILEAVKKFDHYFGNMIHQRRSEPRDDLVTRLVEAQDTGDKLTSGEMKALLRVLLVAGNETTQDLIGNGTKALLLHRDQLDLLRENPALVTSAVEELLRYDSPVQIDTRFTATDVKINNRILEPDSRIACLLGSANRDPGHFDKPDELDITRSGPANLAFGRGIHYCLGAPLARLEGKIVLEVLLERFTNIRFGTRPPIYRVSGVMRGLKHLDVRVSR